MKLYSIAISLCLAFVFSSCHKDIYDPQAIHRDYFIQNVPANFDWSGYSRVEAKIIPNDSYNGNYYYTIEIFAPNEDTETQPIVYAKGVGKQDIPYQPTIMVPATTQNVLIRQTAPTGKQSIRIGHIVNNQLNCNFTAMTATTKPSTRAIGDEDSEFDFEPDMNAYQIEELPNNVIDISQVGYEVSPNQSYILRGNYQGKINFLSSSNGGTLYIAGTWTNTVKDQSLPAGAKIIVLNGGKILTNSQWNLSLGYDCKIAIAPGGKIGENENNNLNLILLNPGKIINKGDFFLKQLSTTTENYSIFNSGKFCFKEDIELKNPGEFVNTGEITGKDISISECNINVYNSGTFTCKTLEANNKNGVIKNIGEMNIRKMDIDNLYLLNTNLLNIGKEEEENDSQLEADHTILHNTGQIIAKKIDLDESAIYNHCRIEVTKTLEIEKSTLYLDAQTSVSCQKLELDEAAIYIGSQAMLVANDTKFEDKNQLTGTGETVGLFKTDKLKCDNGKDHLFIFDGNVEIACSHINQPKHYVTNGSSYFAENGSTVAIPAGKCTGEGNQVEESPAPTDPEFPIIERLNLKHTWLTEDTYPLPSDYDLNDLVVGVDSMIRYINQNNEVTRMTLYMRLKAVGATKRLGAAIQLDHYKASAIESVTRSNNIQFDGQTFELNAQGVEQGEGLVVIPLFDNAHKLLDVPSTRTITNTISSNKTGTFNRPIQEFWIDIHFNKNQTAYPEFVNIGDLNFFVVVENNSDFRKTEIHLPTFKHSEKSKTPQEVQQNTNNLMWALMVPGEFSYAEETVDIRKAYPHFQEWVTSNKTSWPDWYKYPETANLYNR